MRRLAAAVALLVLICGAVPAARGQEQAFSFRVEVNAPEPFRSLLTRHLDIFKWRQRVQRLEQLQRLAERTPRQIQELMATQGYFSAQVRPSLQQAGAEWVARYQVDPGAASRIAAVNIQFAGALLLGGERETARIQQLRSQWPLPPGAVFRQEEWDKGKARLVQELQENGYPAARIVQSEARVNADAREVALTVLVDSGPLFTFGALYIEGLGRYPASIITNLNRITPGSAFSQKALNEFQAELQTLPYFLSVFVTADTDPARPELTPVRVRVEESQANKIGLGTGYSTNNGFGVEVQFEDKDLFDGGQVWRSVVKWETREQIAYTALEFPPGTDRYRWQMGAALQRTDVQGELSTKSRVGLQRSRAEGKIENVQGIEFQLERREVGGPVDDIKALSPIFSWIKRDVDDPVYPRRGYIINLRANAGSTALLSDQDFVRSYGRFITYWPLTRDGTLILRGELGKVFADSRDGIPSNYLFRTGGSTTVRGYEFESLGVRLNGAVVGGRYLANASAEYLHFFTPQWGGAFFIDAGDAADSRTELSPRKGYGVGVRWRSPVGPLGADLAYGEQTENWRLHFAFGITF